MNRSSSFNVLLFFFFGFIAVLIGIRIIYSGKMNYLFLVWNLFLAWLPYMISTGFKVLQRKTMIWKKITLLSIWLIFFPNALYIITDLIHLEQDTNIPKWFDVILIFTSSVVGLIMAFISLFLSGFTWADFYDGTVGILFRILWALLQKLGNVLFFHYNIQEPGQLPLFLLPFFICCIC